MRKVVAYLFYSLDGVVESPDKWPSVVEWLRSGEDDAYGDEMNKAIARQDDVLLGRVTYQEWAWYWPTATDEPFASFINGVRKHVVSTTLTKPDWKNTDVISGDVPAAVRRLKQAPGGDIGVHGSIRLVQSLLRAGLVDELTLAVMPTVAGQGRHLFEPCDAAGLKLARSRVTPTGLAILTYDLAKR